MMMQAPEMINIWITYKNKFYKVYWKGFYSLSLDENEAKYLPNIYDPASTQFGRAHLNTQKSKPT